MSDIRYTIQATTDDGTIIRINCGEDVSLAADFKMKVYQPDKTVKEWTAVLDPLDNNYIRHVYHIGDLTVFGTHKIHGYVEIGTWKGVTKPPVKLKYLELFKE